MGRVGWSNSGMSQHWAGYFIQRSRKDPCSVSWKGGGWEQNECLVLALCTAPLLLDQVVSVLAVLSGWLVWVLAAGSHWCCWNKAVCQFADGPLINQLVVLLLQRSDQLHEIPAFKDNVYRWDGTLGPARLTALPLPAAWQPRSLFSCGPVPAVTVCRHCARGWVLPAPPWFGGDHLARGLSSAHLSSSGCWARSWWCSAICTLQSSWKHPRRSWSSQEWSAMPRTRRPSSPRW